MDLDKEREINEAAYRRLRPMIDQTYPKGRFVALEKGAIIADGASIKDLLDILRSQGKDSRGIMVAETGDDLPDYAIILPLNG
jgi:hypothetical protein